MGRGSATSLAPGFRFHPTDEELVRYYLKRKVCGLWFVVLVLQVESSSCFSHLCSSALRAKTLTTPSSSSEASVNTNSGEGLVRRLGLFDLILIGVGASIGAGIFVVTGTVAHDIGPGVTISFILAGASCVLNALCYAELASRFPAVVGGAYLYSYPSIFHFVQTRVFNSLVLGHL